MVLALAGSAVINQGSRLSFSVGVLKAAGLTVVVKGNTVTLTQQAAGGADPLAAVSGCLNQPLFNGIWRFKVEIRNGAVLAINSGAPELRDRPFWQAGAFTVTLDFDKNGAAGQPVKLVVALDPAGTLNTGLNSSVKAPSFRVDLTCRQ